MDRIYVVMVGINCRPVANTVKIFCFHRRWGTSGLVYERFLLKTGVATWIMIARNIMD